MELATLFAGIVLYAIGLLVLYGVIRSAVRAAVRGALSDHYKTVRLYERTGEWLTGDFGTNPPRVIEPSQK
jgi:uncharacterized membrane protein